MGRVSSRAVSRWSRSPGCCGFRGVFWVRRDFVFFFRFIFFECTRPAASMRPPCLICIYTSVTMSPFAADRAQKSRYPGVRTRFHYLISLCLCVTFVVLLIARAVRGRFHKRGIYGSGRVWANAWDVFRRAPCRGGRGRWAAVGFVVCFGCGGISCFFSFFFFERKRPAASMRPPCLIFLYTSNEARLTERRDRGFFCL